MKQAISSISVLCFVCAIAGMGCKPFTGTAEQNQQTQQTHWAEVNNPALGLLYVDEYDAVKVMQPVSDGPTRFVGYKVGIPQEQQQTDARHKEKRGKYLQYDMPYDWSLKIQQDSFAAVFFQPVVKAMSQQDEGVLIFEIPANATPDTLIYQDSFGGWGTQKIILTSH